MRLSDLPPDVRGLLIEYRERLADTFGSRLLSVRVFGSQARGDARPDSDLDVAVVIRDLAADEWRRAVDLGFEVWLSRLSRGARGPLPSPLVWSDAEEAERLQSERRIALDIQREGIPV